MAFTKQELSLEYSWQHTREDDPKLRGAPDHSLLNRREGYEVLYMIGQLMEEWSLKNASDGRKIERMIRDHPASLRSQIHVRQWIYNNWDRYQAG